MLGSLIASYVGAIALGDTASGIAVGLVLAVHPVSSRPLRPWPSSIGSFPARPRLALDPLRRARLPLPASRCCRPRTSRIFGWRNFERRYASDGVATVVLLGLWLYAANAVLRSAIEQRDNDRRRDRNQPPRRDDRQVLHSGRAGAPLLGHGRGSSTSNLACAGS